MNLAERWHEQKRTIKNLSVVLAVDLFLLLGAIFALPGLKATWMALTDYLPNIYEPIFLQLIAFVRGASPGSVVASGPFVTFSTIFLTLFTFHGVLAYGIGHLFQKFKPSLGWSVVNYGVLILALFLLHLVLVLKNYWLYLS